MGCGHLRAWIAGFSSQQLFPTPVWHQNCSTAQMVHRRYQPKELKCCWQPCWHACTASDFLTEAPMAISAGLFRAVWTLWWYSYLGVFFWNWGLSAKLLLTFEEMHGGRCCLWQSKCCITGSCNWNSFLQAARDSEEIINNWGITVPDEGNSCCRCSFVVLVVINWFQKGR